jgi:hypothetical protein
MRQYLALVVAPENPLLQVDLSVIPGQTALEPGQVHRR